MYKTSPEQKFILDKLDKFVNNVDNGTSKITNDSTIDS